MTRALLAVRGVGAVTRVGGAAVFMAGSSTGTPIALLFIASMVTIGAGFAVFLFETRLGARAVRVRSDLLQHRVDDST